MFSLVFVKVATYLNFIQFKCLVSDSRLLKKISFKINRLNFTCFFVLDVIYLCASSVQFTIHNLIASWSDMILYYYVCSMGQLTLPAKWGVIYSAHVIWCAVNQSTLVAIMDWGILNQWLPPRKLVHVSWLPYSLPFQELYPWFLTIHIMNFIIPHIFQELTINVVFPPLKSPIINEYYIICYQKSKEFHPLGLES